MADIYKSVEWAVQVAEDDSHGYDQQYRNGPDYDCSSFVSTALNKGGFNISPYSWTGNMVSQLKKDGFYEVPIDDKRQLGDVFIHEEHHVVLCVDAHRIVQASINEKGGIKNGEKGDQTGREIYVGTFYHPYYGWQYHLRPPKSAYKHESLEEQKQTKEFTIIWR